jgi:hypothetical protein
VLYTFWHAPIDMPPELRSSHSVRIVQREDDSNEDEHIHGRADRSDSA